ncbi:hypothetical protein PybrP1_009755 [[Pythium] brassicae (nom. inval.)]|nr:hypothetical protein PybrP1_009755 [[Pythium] brassicae (nom. inval.)]
MESKRGGAAAAAKDAGAELKRVAKFFASDRPPRKRLRTLLEFLKAPAGGGAAEPGNIAGAVQSLLSGAKDAGAAAAEHGAALSDFWADPASAAALFAVVSDCVAELETLYSPHEVAFRKPRRRPLEAEDWTDVFEGLEALVRFNVPLLHEGWNHAGFAALFAKLLRRDNHALIKKYAFRCLALYADATRSKQQLAAIATAPLTAQAAGANAVMLLSDMDAVAATDAADSSSCDNDSTAAATGSSRGVGGSARRKNLHLDLLRESVDFSPYGGGSILLPDKFLNEGVHVEGWMRPTPTQADEPVDMLKFVMDLSLEREEPRLALHPRVNHAARGDRFEFWCELIMKFYMPLLYPKVCVKHKLKDEKDAFGFFHHCPGSFQRVVARWLYKLRSRDEFLDALWAKREFAEVVMETVRQRFAYRDMELVLDAIKFYSGLCSGAQYAPEGMRAQMNDTLRAMISHVSQLFHPSVVLEDAKMLLHSIELLELISQRRLDDYTATYLRKFVVSTIDNCVVLREPGNLPVLSAMLSVVLHVWMHAAATGKATGAPVWLELTVAMRRWLVSPTDAKAVAAELVHCWKRELRFASCLLLYVLDQGQSMLKVTADGAVLVPHSATGAGAAGAGTSSSRESKVLKDLGGKQGYLHSSATFLTTAVVDQQDATLLLDRVLHLLPPPTVAALAPHLHLSVFEGLLQLVELWIGAAICSPRATPTSLHQISPSTVLALFGEWFLPACELESPEYQSSRCLAIVMLCKLCSVRCVNPVTASHLTVLARVLFKGVTSPSGVVVSTVLQQASSVFTLNLAGLNALVPAFLYTVDQVIVQNIWGRAEKVKAPKASDWNKELTAALDVVFSILALPTRFPRQNFVSWQHRLRALQSASAASAADRGALGALGHEIPDSREPFAVILGRVLVRISDLPFVDIADIKKRALWGIYTLVVTSLEPPSADSVANSVGDTVGDTVDPAHLTEWVVHLIEACQATDFSISMTALGILQDVSDHHEAIYALEPALVDRIVMTLAVFAQQQVEEASIEVQAAIESLGPGALDAGTNSDALAAMQRTSGGGTLGSRRGSDNRTSRLAEPSSEGGASDPFSKLKNKLKPTGSTPLQGAAAAALPAAPPSPALPSPPRPREQDVPALRLIVQKTSAIFECLRFWVMQRPAALQDRDVRKLVFSAIEAALVGSLPDGEWQKEVERARSQERRMSMPLLFLGLQMRASLYSEASHAWLKFFDETAVAAEGLLMHLLHHLNGFPSPAGVDQMISNCAEMHERDDDATSGGGAAGTASAPASFSFVFMNSIVITVVGSLDSPCARFVARDMTGLFTWEIAPALSPNSPARFVLDGVDGGGSASAALSPTRAASAVVAGGAQSFSLHDADAAVRVDSKQPPDGDAESAGACRTCGGDKPSASKTTEPAAAPTAAVKLALRQVPWEREEAILGNTLCSAKSTYVYHDEIASSKAGAGGSDAPAAAAGDKKKAGGGGASREKGEEKMPGAGNRDERAERLEKIARMYEERNHVGAHALSAPTLSTGPPVRKKCECEKSSKRARSASMRSDRAAAAAAAAVAAASPPVSVLGLFEMDPSEANVGSLDTERSLLDLVLDSIPVVFRDGMGDTTDKTLLGGRYAMQRYNLMDRSAATSPLVKDPADAPGFSFLQRLIHDEECYAQLKAFLTKDEHAADKGKELVEFCDAVKRFERSTVPTDRLGLASVIFWEFFTSDSARALDFPPAVTADIQLQLQRAQAATRSRELEEHALAGSLFESAMAHVEFSFENSGLLDKYVAALDQAPAPVAAANGSVAPTGSKDAAAAAAAAAASIPPQLGLFDAFSVMELNARISHAALTKRNADAATAALTKPQSLTSMELKQAAEHSAAAADATATATVTATGGGVATSRVGALDMCRLFLSQTGLLPSPNGDVRAKAYLKLLESGAKLERSLKHLDKSPVRETMKIGVIYVGKGQQSQHEILRNDRGSAAYERFLAQLGWEVELAAHRGFAGGLDVNPRSLSTGATTLYFANSHSEVAFHVVTKMPTKPSDPQQIDKKRHVGNDFVHIVWSDNSASAYDPGTITSHFNDVQIVLYPLRKAQRGLVHVQIFSKDKVPLFGPLQSGMVVHELNLAALVRQTAMNANRVCRSLTSLYVRPYPTRKKLVDEIVERYAVEYKETQLLTHLFTNSPATSSLSSSMIATGGSSSTD